MIESPSLWGLLPLAVFIVLVFLRSHPVVAVLIASIVGAIMAGASAMEFAEQVNAGLSGLLAQIALIILLGGGLGKITDATGVAALLARTIITRIGVKTPNRAIISTMLCSGLMVGSLGTMAGANTVIAPVIIPIVASAGLSTSAVAIIFQGVGATGLWLGPFTAPMVTLIELTGLSYWQIVLYASLPLSAALWIATFLFVKLTLKKSLIEHSYPEEVLQSIDEMHNEKASRATIRATAAFVVTLLTLIVIGIIIQGGVTFALVVISVTGTVTGLFYGIRPNDIAENFFEGAKPLVWLFFLFVFFSPFIYFVGQMGGFESLRLLLDPIVSGTSGVVTVIITTLTGVAGIPGAAVAQSVILDEMFSGVFQSAGIPSSLFVLMLLAGSQLTEFLYPVSDTLMNMGIARSNDLKRMMYFGVAATVTALIVIVIVSMVVV